VFKLLDRYGSPAVWNLWVVQQLDKELKKFCPAVIEEPISFWTPGARRCAKKAHALPGNRPLTAAAYRSYNLYQNCVANTWGGPAVPPITLVASTT
jgi:hypothetical protein